jgi:hypothetical protein
MGNRSSSNRSSSLTYKDTVRVVNRVPLNAIKNVVNVGNPVFSKQIISNGAASARGARN